MVVCAIGAPVVGGTRLLASPGDDYVKLKVFSLLPVVLALIVLGSLRARLREEILSRRRGLLPVRAVAAVGFTTLALAAALPGVVAVAGVSAAGVTRCLAAMMAVGLVCAPLLQLGSQVTVVLCYWFACFVFGWAGVPAVNTSVIDVTAQSWNATLPALGAFAVATVVYAVYGDRPAPA